MSERQPIEDGEVFLLRCRIEREALVLDPSLAGDDGRHADRGEFHAHLRAVDQRAVAEFHRRISADVAFRGE